MRELAIQYIRKNIQKGCLDYSQHAIERMLERGIEDSQVIDCILKGKVIEEQNFVGQDIKILFQEATINTPKFYAVVAAACPRPVVVTVCNSKNEVWECVNGTMQRRQKNMINRKCYICGTEMNETEASINGGWGKYKLTISGVRAYECPKCGEKVFRQIVRV